MADAPRASRRPHSRLDAFQPLTMTWLEVAGTVFRRSESWLHDHIAEFGGFPHQDASLGLFNREQVEQWVRQRYGIAPIEGGTDAATQRILARLTGGPGPGALSR